MDRLPALSGAAVVVALSLVLGGCKGDTETPARARTEGVAASTQAPAPERWCDAFYTASTAPPLALPRVVPARPGGQLPVLAADRWVWVNLWATWCEPCRREMPLVVRWHEQLVKEAVPVDLLFVSVDERERDLVTFLKANPAMAPGNSVRLASYSDLEPWLGRLPGAPAGSIPLQIIAAPGGKVRCVRAGSLREGDLPIVRELFRR